MGAFLETSAQELKFRNVQKTCQGTFGKKISGSLNKNVQNMATTTQLIQKYKTIQKSTSSVPTVLYLKLRLFLTDSDRMCDSDIHTQSWPKHH